MIPWRRFLSLWLPVLLWMAVIFIGSNQQDLPVPESPAADLLIKKSGHALEYAILGLLLLRAVAGSHGAGMQTGTAFVGRASRPATVAPALLTVVIGGLYAASDELHQRFVPTRKGNLRDVLIDVSALTAAVLLAWLWQRYRSRFRSPPR